MFLLQIIASNLLTTGPAQLTLDLSQAGVKVSPMLYGQMTEEINFSYDGGLYGELVRNRAFLDDGKQPAHWTPTETGASIELQKVGPSEVRPMALQVRGGVANEGYWGIPVRPATKYRLKLWAKADAATKVIASLESRDGKTVWAKTEIEGLDPQWHDLTATFETAKRITPTKDARLVLRPIGGSTMWLAQVSLFPPTYNNQPNGNRPDLMKMLVKMKPKFLRFPGGNYVEGSTLADYYPWKKTIGPIEGRPGHWSPWGYRSSDGMGLLEFLLWCEASHAKPVLAVYAGYALNGKYFKPGSELAPFVQDAVEEIEYAVGDPKTTRWGAQRAKDGHSKPFPIEAVEVGNEDGFDKSGSYPDRFKQFYDAIKAKYPQVKVISTTGGKDFFGQLYPITQRNPDLWDEHYYSEAWDMLAMSTKYDSYDRNGPKVFVGEWASHDTIPPWQAGPNAGPTPNLKCTIGDAAFMTGLERNSDVVSMACYAPLLVNVNPGGRQWSLNLIGYDALTSFGSPSYYAQKMFAENLGDRTVAITTTEVPSQFFGKNKLPSLYASCTHSSKTGEIYLKLVNALSIAQSVSFEVKGGSIQPDGTITTLHGNDLKLVNTIEEPLKVAPKTSSVAGLGSRFKETLPAYSVTVLKLQQAN